MGGKSSKLKIKKIETEKEKQTQEKGKSAEQKEGVENGELPQNEVAPFDNADKDTETATEKSEEAATDLTEKTAEDGSASRSEKESTQLLLVAESTSLLPETTSAETQQAVVHDSSKNETSTKESPKETKSEELIREEVHEKLEQPASQKEPYPPEQTEEKKSCVTETSTDPIEQVVTGCEKTQEGNEGEKMSAASSDALEIVATTTTPHDVSDIGVTNGLNESTNCDAGGLENNALQEQSDS